jgi:hypothetical protein
MQIKFLSRDEAAQYLTEHGLKTAKGTLQKLVTTGGGPAYRRFGKRSVYLVEELDEWAKEKLSAPRRSSSASGCRTSATPTA